MASSTTARTEETPAYIVPRTIGTSTAIEPLTPAEENLIHMALEVLRKRMTARDAFTSPTAVKDYVQLMIASREHEVFAVMCLDAQNRLIEAREEFRGTLTQTSVYPREIMKTAMRLNAAAVVFAHNHPSGTVQPSRADEALTQTLKTALALMDVRVLDHIIVAPGAALSMAEKGLI